MKRETAHGAAGFEHTVVCRDATPNDMAFLREMTYEAAFWRDDARPELERALADEDIARYVPRLGRSGDITVIAERDGRPVGAAWARCFPAASPGYGFVAADVPELAVAVNAASRRRGIATELLRQVLARARERGFRRVSLSVTSTTRPRGCIGASASMRSAPTKTRGSWSSTFDRGATAGQAEAAPSDYARAQRSLASRCGPLPRCRTRRGVK